MQKKYKNNLLISICTITYNHEKYISQAIESFLMQNTTFEYEIVIADDASQDNNQKIINKYQNENPDKIKAILQEHNIGMMNNLIDALNNCKGKYLAFCEGDDYWTDPLKLQKQVDFLEANPEFGLVATDIIPVDKDSKLLEGVESVEAVRRRFNSGWVFWDLMKGNFINTLTVCIRRELIADLIPLVKKEKLWYVYDYWFWLHVASRTKIKIMEDKTAAYCIHSGGASQKKDFFHKRIPLVRTNALQYFLQQHPYKELTSEEKALAGKVFWKTLFSKKLNIREKKVLWNIIYTSPCILCSFVHLVQSKILFCGRNG